jgi:hypothetical protein
MTLAYLPLVFVLSTCLPLISRASLLLLLDPSQDIRLKKAPSPGHFKTRQFGALRKPIDRLLGYVQKPGNVVNRESLRSSVDHWCPTQF